MKINNEHNHDITDDAIKTEKLKSSNQLARGQSSGDAEERKRKVLFSVRNFLIVLALSVHSIFEGMAIGKKLVRGRCPIKIPAAGLIQ